MVKKDFLIIVVLVLTSLAVYHKALFNFFAQDDFILIKYFSQNGILTDFAHSFAKPEVTHWRPVHNLYFLFGGNLFGKNYFFYHLVTLVIHISNGFLLFKILRKLKLNWGLAITSAVIYLAHSAHFVTMYWISGSATSIGFLFFLLAFICYIDAKELFATFFLSLSLLASEAMFIGFLVLVAYDLIFEKKHNRRFLAKIAVVVLAIGTLKAWFIISSKTLQTYKPEVSPKDFLAVKYYIARVLGFAEGASAKTKIFQVILLIVSGAGLLQSLQKEAYARLALFAVIIICLGLIPFVFLPEHLSAHYMNFSIWGLAVLVAIGVWHFDKSLRVGLISLFLIISIVSIGVIEKNHWVVKRANLARKYLQLISNDNLPANSRIVFADGPISTSFDAYIALGTGRGLDFWFPNKHYQACFTAFEKC